MRGVTFGNYHTWNDWGLLLSSFPMIEPPQPQSKTLSIPARDGQIDLSRALDGHIHYNSRKVTFKFLCKEKRDRWTEVYSQMLSTIQGQQMQVRLDDIPDCYLYGVFQLEKPTYKDKYCIFTVTGVCDPYMYEINTSDEDWLWDAFSFEEGVIRDYRNIDVNGELAYTIIGSKRPSRPQFFVTAGNLSVAYQGHTYPLATGRINTIPQIYIAEGEHTLTFTGTGSLKVIYQGGRL